MVMKLAPSAPSRPSMHLFTMLPPSFNGSPMLAYLCSAADSTMASKKRTVIEVDLEALAAKLNASGKGGEITEEMLRKYGTVIQEQDTPSGSGHASGGEGSHVDVDDIEEEPLLLQRDTDDEGGHSPVAGPSGLASGREGTGDAQLIVTAEVTGTTASVTTSQTTPPITTRASTTRRRARAMPAASGQQVPIAEAQVRQSTMRIVEEAQGEAHGLTNTIVKLRFKNRMLEADALDFRPIKEQFMPFVHSLIVWDLLKEEKQIPPELMASSCSASKRPRLRSPPRDQATSDSESQV